jgi:trimeric autotransporter adhesin
VSDFVLCFRLRQPAIGFGRGRFAVSDFVLCFRLRQPAIGFWNVPCCLGETRRGNAVLGTSATIAGGAVHFTAFNNDNSSYTTSGSGPETDTDTASGVAGTAKVSGSGSSSQYTWQLFGDTLGSGGVISSGSLSYEVTSSETDADSTTDSGTETIPDELGGPSQTASYSITESTPDNETAYETGTETLGSGGTISSGSDSFSWSIGNSLNRNLGISGISAILGINESSTDTYGFGESGTETITTGGSDVPGTVSFVWTQMGTDNYQIGQANTTGSSSTDGYDTTSYSLGMTNTQSSSWKDTGADVLSDDDEVVGETDSYTWAYLNSVTDSLTETETVSESYPTTAYGVSMTDGTANYSGWAIESLSLSDSGAQTLGVDVSDPSSWSVAGETDQFTIQDSIANGYGLAKSWSFYWLPGEPQGITTLNGTSTEGESDVYSLSDAGSDSLSGSTSDSSDSYAIANTGYSSTTAEVSGTGPSGTYSNFTSTETTNSINADGTDSFGPGDDVESTLSLTDAGLVTTSLDESFQLSQNGVGTITGG